MVKYILVTATRWHAWYSDGARVLLGKTMRIKFNCRPDYPFYIFIIIIIIQHDDNKAISVYNWSAGGCRGWNKIDRPRELLLRSPGVHSEADHWKLSAVTVFKRQRFKSNLRCRSSNNNTAFANLKLRSLNRLLNYSSKTLVDPSVLIVSVLFFAPCLFWVFTIGLL